ncbi:hypothetical protein CWR48_08045 [Oceanobacillus arenosus]|uniref:Uncharacterized protein n=1 Tax=Oceanobacillus arenosus TaxID=1229153 RepID=A0A3D8PTF6_9BACI|nr:hypothetical protein [Oceanobacillus arenosus]RDW19440.1 hypothetical protein CWR48_08045 [Oceanobacillus arenosus]
MKNLLYILLFILLLSFVGCSNDKQATSSIFSFTQEEENDLQKIAYQFLEDLTQNEIISGEQATISGFKSGSEFVVFNKKNSETTTDIKEIQTILVTFATKDESTYESINVYLDEKGEKVLGFRTEDK